MIILKNWIYGEMNYSPSWFTIYTLIDLSIENQDMALVISKCHKVKRVSRQN